MRLAATLKLCATALAAGVIATPVANALDQSFPAYQSVPGISGQIKSVGSDTLGDLIERWSKGFEGVYPDVHIAIEAKGSATAPPALIEGASQFGPMLRPMTAEELDAFAKKYGYAVSNFRVAVDALAVYVNKDNPIACLSEPQLNRIFSSERVAAFGGDIATWGDVGLTGEWATKPIALYGRNSLSGTYEFFKEMALNGGDYKTAVKQQPGSEAVVESVAGDRFAIGYSGIGYKTAGVRTVPLTVTSGGPCYDTSADATYSGKYPLACYLYVYLNKNPNQPLDAPRAEFIKYILSKDGQTETEKGGFYPITNDIRTDELKKLAIPTVTQ